jgi:hypothetical protein
LPQRFDLEERKTKVKSGQKCYFIDFVDSYKHRPRALMLRVRKSAPLMAEIRKILEPAVKDADWPTEFRSWEAALLGLLASQIGGIASPFLRQHAAEELFRVAGRIGLSRAKMLMIADDIYRIETKIKLAEISVQQG